MSKCFRHVESDAIGYCRQCGKGLCDACCRSVREATYCEDCLAATVAAPSSASSSPNPGVALALALIPGVGAIYNGEYMKALIQILVLGGVISLADSSAFRPMEGLLVLMGLAFYAYTVIDAYQTAAVRARGAGPVRDPWATPEFFTRRGSPGGPLILIVFGALLLFNSLGVFFWVPSLWRLWPLALIGVGIWLLRNRIAAGEQG